MKHFRIVPAAAGVIALTAVTCFAQDMRENEEFDSTRTKVTVRTSTREAPAAHGSIFTLPSSGDRMAAPLYLVEIVHGGNSKEIVVDGNTGKILGKRDLADPAT